MKSQFRFRKQVRKFVKSLTELAEFANREDKGRWHWQSSDRNSTGVFGYAIDTIEAIIREECGEEILKLIGELPHGYNWGGCQTWLDDVEVAITAAMEERIGRLERAALLAEAKPLITEEGYDDLTYYSLEDLRHEVKAIKDFVPDPNIGM